MSNLKRKFPVAILFMLLMSGWLFAAGSASADSSASSAVYRLQVDKPVAEVYDNVYKSLEEAKFFVVFEPDIGANLSRFSEKWGDEYNQNKLTAIRSMVFCNGWYANQVSNADPDMLGICPLHLSLVERDGKTTVLFNRPAAIAQNSPAKAVLQTIEAEVIEAIKAGLE
jgi:uncharacterized protein (DUF302 family)